MAATLAGIFGGIGVGLTGGTTVGVGAGVAGTVYTGAQVAVGVVATTVAVASIGMSIASSVGAFAPKQAGPEPDRSRELASAEREAAVKRAQAAFSYNDSILALGPQQQGGELQLGVGAQVLGVSA